MVAYALIVAFARIVAALPLGRALALGRGLGHIAFHVVRLRRSVVLANLHHVLGATRSQAELLAIAGECYRQFAMTFVELLRSTAPGASGLERNVSFDSFHPFEKLRAEKRALVILQPHAGNFDLAAYAFAERGFPHHTVMKLIENPRLQRLIASTRERHGVTVHVKAKKSFEEIVAALRKGDWVGLLPDQNAKGRGVTVDWLGSPASIFKGPALFHLATGAPICLALDERLADPRRHHVHFRFLAPRAPTGDEAADVRAIMQDVADAYAPLVLRNPAQYFWFHRLWGKDVAPAA
jgi:Kdo2-lipid IVA lauroyltransferase/acyltransferase